MARSQRHGLVQEKQFGPAPGGHDLSATALVSAATDQPRLARPTLAQQRLDRGVVDDSPVPREHSTLGDSDDVAERSDSVL